VGKGIKDHVNKRRTLERKSRKHERKRIKQGRRRYSIERKKDKGKKA
jgi:hypothetical protein